MTKNKVLFKSEEVFEYHLGGKIGLDLVKKLTDQKDLSMAYTPGVSKICQAIEEDDKLTYSLTSKGNLVAVVTDGTAVLGLGNIGAKASIPVMEGKALLYKYLGGGIVEPDLARDVIAGRDRGDADEFRQLDILREVDTRAVGQYFNNAAVAPFQFE